MKILHITPHLGGGVGTVVSDWAINDDENKHSIVALDSINSKMIQKLLENNIPHVAGGIFLASVGLVRSLMVNNDIVVVHTWDHPYIPQFFLSNLPDSRMAFWCHKNVTLPEPMVDYPDRFFGTSPIQGYEEYIWSTGNMERFLDIEPISHEKFNVGYIGTVDYKKIHPLFLYICREILQEIPTVHFTIVGENNLKMPWFNEYFTFTGKVDDVRPCLAEMDVFGYPLHSSHYGTCEQVLGEAMASGVPPVVLDHPAEREIVQGSLYGCIENSIFDYIDAIKFLHRHPDIRKRMGERAKGRAFELYSINYMIDKWNEIFDQMMEKPKTDKGKMIL